MIAASFCSWTGLAYACRKHIAIDSGACTSTMRSIRSLAASSLSSVTTAPSAHRDVPRPLDAIAGQKWLRLTEHVVDRRLVLTLDIKDIPETFCREQNRRGTPALMSAFAAMVEP